MKGVTNHHSDFPQENAFSGSEGKSDPPKRSSLSSEEPHTQHDPTARKWHLLNFHENVLRLHHVFMGSAKSLTDIFGRLTV